MSDSNSDNDFNPSLIDYNNDEFNAMKSESSDENLDEDLSDQRFQYIDHFFDINSSLIKIKSNDIKSDEYLVAESEQTPSSCVEDYFNSINYNQVAKSIFVDDKNITIANIEKYFKIGGKSFFLVDINNEKHILNNDILPPGVRNSLYEGKMI